MNVNPLQLVQMIKQGQNPQQLILSVLKQNFGSTPIGENLTQMIENNDTQGIENFVKNLVASQGKDFDKEFNSFKQTIGIK